MIYFDCQGDFLKKLSPLNFLHSYCRNVYLLKLMLGISWLTLFFLQIRLGISDPAELGQGLNLEKIAEL